MTLEEIRRKIDAVDNQILALLNERAGLAKAVGDLKRRLADGPSTLAGPKFFDPEREHAIIERIERHAREDGFPRSALPSVYKEIISACRSLESAFRVAYLGPEGTYTQIAAQKLFGRSVSFLDIPTIDGIFDAISRGQAEYGVTPIENSYEGGVTASLDGLLRSEGLFIRRQMVMRVDHCLISKANDVGSVRKLHSHPQALGQCRLWIGKNLPGAEVLTAKSTAAAARIALEDREAAAIASRLSAELLGMNVLREAIQDQRDNSTRFVVLAREEAPPTNHDQTSIVVSLRSKPGALMKALKVLNDSKLPVLRLESRAGSDRLWRYMYFIDFAGHRVDRAAGRALKRLSKLCERIKVLGSYPRVDSLSEGI